MTMESDAEDTDADGTEVDFSEYRELDVSITADGFADLASLDVNGTDVIFKQNEYVPVLVEIYVGTEETPVGTINIAKGCTVTLGGVQEGLAREADGIAGDLRELSEKADEMEALAERLNPTGQPGGGDPAEDATGGDDEGGGETETDDAE